MAEGYSSQDFSEESVRELVGNIYGLEVSATRLTGERDFNFKIETKKKRPTYLKSPIPVTAGR